MLIYSYYFPTANCYKKVIEETKLMQEKIKNSLGLEPVDKEVVILYDGERNKVSATMGISTIIEIDQLIFKVFFSTNFSRTNTGRVSVLSKWKNPDQTGSTRT